MELGRVGSGRNDRVDSGPERRVEGKTSNLSFAHRTDFLYTTALNPHSALSHSPIAPPFTDCSALHQWLRPAPIVPPYTDRVTVGVVHLGLMKTVGVVHLGLMKAGANGTCLRMDWWKHSVWSSPLASGVCLFFGYLVMSFFNLFTVSPPCLS
ncbi:hypothetical protein CROQUDRAFT_210521 [Cronartium quercuum f. sp. fusiforme G11]|uniref:Uncharacterized protein n=1 Tax=Cronartium quercuum f. sp. fusiforme G11 TaxID=708437 RepID=A0A9P6NA74_9BASI|nr:hypothetical protein CROQUDRAFT_210521 [Cronartium quercuum f. sp. fusiforme G11]